MKHVNKNRLLDLHFREGSPRRAKRTRRHVEACPDCREDLRTLARAEELLQAWPDEKPAAGTLDRVLARLPEERPRFRPARAPQPLLPLAGIAGGIAFILLVLSAGRSVLERFAFWQRLQEGWLARTFGDFGLTLILFLALSGLAALSLVPFFIDYAKRSSPCHDR